MEEGEIQPEVVEIKDELVTVNNRRLFAAKVLKGMAGGEIWIPVRRTKDRGKVEEVMRRLTERIRLNMQEDVIVTKVKKKGTENDRTLRYLEEGRSWTKELEPYLEKMGKREKATWWEFGPDGDVRVLGEWTRSEWEDKKIRKQNPVKTSGRGVKTGRGRDAKVKNREVWRRWRRLILGEDSIYMAKRAQRTES